MKKRSCRRTNDEERIHEQAVKIRKMTDEQLVDYVTRLKDDSGKVRDFLKFVKDEKVPGIGEVTLNKLMKAAVENGFVQ